MHAPLIRPLSTVLDAAFAVIELDALGLEFAHREAKHQHTLPETFISSAAVATAVLPRTRGHLNTRGDDLRSIRARRIHLFAMWLILGM